MTKKKPDFLRDLDTAIMDELTGGGIKGNAAGLVGTLTQIKEIKQLCGLPFCGYMAKLETVRPSGVPDEVTVVFAEDVPYRACNGIEFDVMQEFVEGSRLLLTGKVQTLKDFRAVGKDYYVYICDSRIDSADEKYVISLNSTYPTGWNATNSRKIGGFHYGRCRKVDSNLQPLNGSSVIFGTGWESAVSNGIVPRSVWTLGHRPKCSPEGMVYLGGGTWVDIYLNSDDGAKGLKSEYGCAPMTGTESMNWYNFVERLAKSGKRLPNYAEFCAYAFGSPAGLDNANTNAWSATSNTGRGVTGSVVNAVSSVGVVDAVGRVWEWLDELITRAEHATNADYHASVAWGWDKKSPLNAGEKSYDVGNIYQYYAYSLAALMAGGDWNDGARCGARAVYCSRYPWNVYTYVGARGACDSL